MKCCDNVGDPSYFPAPDRRCHVLFTKHSLQSLEVVKKRTNVNVFGPQFFRGDDPSRSTADY